MALPTLEDLTPAIDRACADLLGDTIRYAADGSTFEDVRADVDYTDAVKAFESAQVVTQDIAVSLLMADVPARPGAAVRITLPKLPGLTFKPVNVRRGESGTEWMFDLQVTSG